MQHAVIIWNVICRYLILLDYLSHLFSTPEFWMFLGLSWKYYTIGHYDQHTILKKLDTSETKLLLPFYSLITILQISISRKPPPIDYSLLGVLLHATLISCNALSLRMRLVFPSYRCKYLSLARSGYNLQRKLVAWVNNVYNLTFPWRFSYSCRYSRGGGLLVHSGITVATIPKQPHTEYSIN